MASLRPRLRWWLLAAVAVRPAAAADAPPAFAEHVLPVFREKCCGCHNPDKRQGGLDLTTHAAALAGGSSGAVIDPGDPDGSYLWQLASHSGEPKMPPQSDRLPPEMLAVIRGWIAGGAIDRAGGQPIARRAAPGLTVDPAAVAGPSGPPVMPPRLPLDVATRGSRALAITGLAVSPNGRLAAVGGRRQVLLYDTESLEFLGVFPFPEGDVKVVRFSRSAKLLLAGGGVGGKNGRVVLWDVATATRVGELGDEFDQVLAADISADQSVVALGGPQKVVRLVRTSDGGVDAEIRRHTDWITALEFSPDGRLLATGDRAGNAYLWETRGAREDAVLSGHAGGINALAWRPDGGLVATAAEDGKVRLWSRKDGSKLKEWEAHPGGVLGIAWLADGRLVSGGRDGKVVAWKPDGDREREHPSPGDLVLRVAVTAGGDRLFAGDVSGRLVVSAIADGRPLGEPDTNPPPLAERLAAAEAAVRAADEAGRALATRAKTAAEAMQVAESQLAAARKALEEMEAELATAQGRTTAATTALDRIRGEVEFARSRK